MNNNDKTVDYAIRCVETNRVIFYRILGVISILIGIISSLYLYTLILIPIGIYLLIVAKKNIWYECPLCGKRIESPANCQHCGVVFKIKS